MTPQQIGDILYCHRRKARLSRRALSELSGLGTTTIYDIEHGKPSAQLQGVLILLQALNITVRFESSFMKECSGSVGTEMQS